MNDGSPSDMIDSARAIPAVAVVSVLAIVCSAFMQIQMHALGGCGKAIHRH